MTEQVNVDVVANDKGSPAWKRQMDAVAAYNRELARIEIEQRRNAAAAAAFDKAIARVGNQIAGTAARYVSLTSAATAYLQIAEEVIRKSEQAASAKDENARRFRVQAGLDALGGEAARKKIVEAAIATASTSEDAFGAATALTSTGFDAESASGSGLRAVLNLIQAQQLKGKTVNADDLAESASKYLASQGLEKNGQNLQTLAVAIQGLKETPMKITDLAQLAKQGATLKGKIGMPEQIANFAMLLESMDAEKAGTSLREVALHMSTAGGAKDKTRALAQIGLKPEDVDLVGESFDEALGKIQGGLQTVPESKRATILKTLFEAANIASYQLLADNRDKVARYVQQEGDVAGFNADVAIGTSGRNAAARRQAVREQERMANLNKDGDLVWGAAAEQMRSDGISEFQIGVRKRGYDLARSMGFSPETAINTIVGSNVASTGSSNAEVRKAIQANKQADLGPLGSAEDEIRKLREATERNTEAVEQQNAAGQRPQKFTPRTDTRPPGQRPSAGLGGGA